MAKKYFLSIILILLNLYGLPQLNTCFETVPDYLTPAGWQLGSMGGFYTYTEAKAELDTMHLLFPNLITERKQIATFTSIEGRPMEYLRISNNPDVDQNKPQILFTSVHHSQEPAGLQQLIYFMYYLLENYESNAEIKYFIDNAELYFIPFVNPDGYVYNETQNPNGGGLWRKNRRNNGLSYGVDLNRNYDYEFGYDEIGSSSIGFHVWYRGDSAFSEPETQAIKYFIEHHNIRIDLNWHAYGNMIIYPWNYSNHYTSDSTFFESMGNIISKKNHYRFGTVYETYGYQSNGDADDWGYGETSSKNKIFSFTGECGNSSDGFWPSVSRIEPICREALSMNLELLKMITKYAKVTDNSETILLGSGNIPFHIQCLGVDTPASFQVSFTPITGNISFPVSQFNFNQMHHMQKIDDVVQYNYSGSQAQWEQVEYTISVNNGIFTWVDTITRFAGPTQILLFDSCENMVHWSGSNWGLSNGISYSGNSAINESPNGNYSILQSSEIICSQNFDLTQAEKAFVAFKAKWNLEKNYDYVQIMVSTNGGTSWQAVCGRYSNFGSDDEELGQPVYDGINSYWVTEEINLNEFIGQTVQLKFYFYSDQNNTRDGFYFDDFKVSILRNSTGINRTLGANQLFSFYNSENLLHVSIDKKTFGPYNIKIYDTMGRLLSNKNTSNYFTDIDLSGLSKGLYLISVSNNNYKLHERFFKH